MVKSAKSKSASKGKSKSKKRKSADLMPSGILTGGGGSYAERMSMEDFRELATHPIEMAIGDAEAMGIPLKVSTVDIDNKVRRIVKASGFHFSETKNHVRVGIQIAASAMAMFGGRPDPINLQSLLVA